MVTLQLVRASNARMKDKRSFLPGLVAIFVGGTSGIAESTAKQFAKHASSPKIYLVGRNQEAATRIVTQLKEINEEGQYEFIRKDVSLLKNVDEVCEEIKSKEQKVNLLFMTPGTMALDGRNETAEGIDRKLATNYYARMRFALQLMPLLEAATPQLARVVSVLSPGTESASFNTDDLGLKQGFSLFKAANHAVCMTDFMFEELAWHNKTISFIHSFPGGVKTGFFKEANPFIRGTISLFLPLLSLAFNMIPIEESGERHLYASTSGRFPGKDGSKAIPATKKEPVMKGSDGRDGSGAYLIGEYGEFKANEKVLKELREKNAAFKVWEHTLGEFKRITGTPEDIPRR